MVTVTLLTQDACGFCDDAKQLLERLAGEFPLVVRELALGSEEGQRLAADGGLLFPPGILLDGEAVSYGRPSERRLRRELRKRTDSR